MSTSFSFGSFNWVCNSVPLSVCPLTAGRIDNIEPQCYARNINIGNLLVFQPATLVVIIVAVIMTAIMIYHIKTKYTAVGRKEMVIFFYMYFVTIIIEFFVISGIIQFASKPYPYFVAIHIGLIVSTLWCLVLNGFVGFQWIEDGSRLSLWSIRLSSLVVFLITFFIGIGTFKSVAGMSPSNTTGLFVFYFLFNLIFVLTYIISQIVLVVRNLNDRWPLGDLLFGTVFFIGSQIFQLAVSKEVCQATKHYVDGYFFGSVCNLLAVMMVYKYWDSITKEDLEFSVGGKSNVWEINDPLLSDDGLAAAAAAGRKY